MVRLSCAMPKMGFCRMVLVPTRTRLHIHLIELARAVSTGVAWVCLGLGRAIFHMWTAPSLQGVLQCFDQIACVHMSGLVVRSHMNAGQDGFRDNSSKQNGDLIEGHWKMRNFSRRGSTDHTICSLSCKFWHQLSTVAVELLPMSG